MDERSQHHRRVRSGSRRGCRRQRRARPRLARVAKPAGGGRSAGGREVRQRRRADDVHEPVQRPTAAALELTDYAERYVVDQLATVPGVARMRLSAAGAVMPCASGSIARRWRRASSRSRTSRTRCAPRTSSCRPAASSRRRASSRCARRPGSTTEEDFRAPGGRAQSGDGYLVRSAKWRTCGSRAEDERTMPPPTASRRISSAWSTVQGQHAGSGGGRAREPSSASSRACRRASQPRHQHAIAPHSSANRMQRSAQRAGHRFHVSCWS